LRTDVDGLAGASRPTALADGLVAAVRGAVAASPVPAHLDVAGTEPALPSVEAAVWFTLAEALTNVARHSGARSVSVDLLLGAEVVLRVTDNGMGGASEHAGSGIAGLRARAESLGGQLLVRSRRGEGTELWLRLPNAPEGGDR
jgi:signal transduction histidine kinase